MSPCDNNVISRDCGFFSFGVGKTECVLSFPVSIVHTMESLTKEWNRLSLSEKEGPGFLLSNSYQSNNFVLAAKFLTKEALNVDAVIKTFKPLWQSRNCFKVKSIGDHILLFIFDNKSEADRVINSEPWSFDKHLVLFQHYNGEVPIRNLVFDKVHFWVQLHNILVRFMNVEVAKKLCEVIGEVCELADELECDGGGFMRIRVSVDVNQPLCRDRVEKMEANFG